MIVQIIGWICIFMAALNAGIGMFYSHADVRCEMYVGLYFITAAICFK